MRKEKKKLGLTFNQQMVLSVLLNAGAVPLIDDQTYTTSAATTPSSANNPEYVHFLEELVGELSGVFATWVHQNPPPSSPTSLADMYHQRTNTCRSTTTTGNEPFSSILSLSLSLVSSTRFNCSTEIIRPLRDCNYVSGICHQTSSLSFGSVRVSLCFLVAN